ncbi:unnamed protein product [Ilex paraguariensis]|uniref:Uncharacterized protein n=1 Tax=Ilex paraguariensis TaxID=185542 RepID=A0ABC8R982_9AQUA
MRNEEAVVAHRSSPPWTALQMLLLAMLFVSSLIQTIDSESDGIESVQWQIINKLNFSSQIRLHSCILFMVTVPWSGESRSLKKDIIHAVSNQQDKFGTLKLMLLYRNSERMLADALGATEGITILYYHHSLSYRYRGRLRAQNILSSAHYLMSLRPEEMPLKSLNTPEDLKTFLESTDKALLLLEFCGWTPRLLAKGKSNETENIYGFNGETNGTVAGEGKKNQKGMENEKMNCGVDIGFSGIPWLREFTLVNESAFLKAENMTPDSGVSCSFEEFHRFESFLSKFMVVAREFFLPPERLRFGLVPERSLISSLGIAESSSWLLIQYSSQCPSCSKVLREGDDLRSFLETQTPLVTEASLSVVLFNHYLLIQLLFKVFQSGDYCLIVAQSCCLRIQVQYNVHSTSSIPKNINHYANRVGYNCYPQFIDNNPNDEVIGSPCYCGYALKSGTRSPTLFQACFQPENQNIHKSPHEREDEEVYHLDCHVMIEQKLYWLEMDENSWGNTVIFKWNGYGSICVSLDLGSVNWLEEVMAESIRWNSCKTFSRQCRSKSSCFG